MLPDLKSTSLFPFDFGSILTCCNEICVIGYKQNKFETLMDTATIISISYVSSMKDYETMKVINASNKRKAKTNNNTNQKQRSRLQVQQSPSRHALIQTNADQERTRLINLSPSNKVDNRERRT